MTFVKKSIKNYFDKMNFNEYDERARKTAVYPNIGNNYVYPVLGLCGEAGEVSEKIKKVIRDFGGVMSDEQKEEIKKELGDVLWYVSAISSELGFTMEEVALKNLEKLGKRAEEGKLHGKGDNR